MQTHPMKEEAIHVLHLLRPSAGGMRTHVRTLLEHHDLSRLRVTLAAPAAMRDALYGGLEDRAGFRGLEMTDPAVPFGLIYSGILLSALIRKEKFHIIHAHGVRATLAAALAGGGARVRLATLHRPLPRPVNPAARSMLTLALRAMDHVVAPSERIRQDLLKAGLDRSQVSLIPEGVDAARVSEADKLRALRSAGLDPTRPVVLFPARLCPGSQFRPVTRAAAEILRLAPEAQLVLAGEAPPDASSRRLQRALAQMGATCTGAVEDLCALLAAASIIVAPAPCPDLSRTLLEAMALGVSPVCVDSGDARWPVHDGVTGRIVPAGNPAALAEAAVSLLRHPEEAERLGNAARERVRTEHSGQQMARRLEILYETLLSRAEGGGACAARL
ncbi:MAG: glycosyltransferase family 4 protein [Armatimonadota bacterium]